MNVHSRYHINEEIKQAMSLIYMDQGNYRINRNEKKSKIPEWVEKNCSSSQSVRSHRTPDQ